MTPRRRQNDQYEPSTARRTVFDEGMRNTWRSMQEMIHDREKRKKRFNDLIDRLWDKGTWLLVTALVLAMMLGARHAASVIMQHVGE